MNLKKGAVLFGTLVVLSLILFSFVRAETNSSLDNNDENSIELAYSCINTQIEDRNSLSLDEAIFSAYALGSKEKIEDSLEDNKKSGEYCWPKSSCTIKQTAQVMLAYDRMGKNFEEIKKWIYKKNASVSELDWYLQVDVQSNSESSCKVKYDGSEKSFKIKSDQKIEGSAGSCFSISSSGYWLKIRENCLDKEFEISCDQDFITNLLYQKGSSGTLFVSSETHSASSLGSTTEKVDAQCFKQGNNCDYEGTLWASFALSKDGEETDKYLPYLLALSEDNQKYFPSAFLYVLTSNNEYFDGIIQSQKQNKYWENVGSVGNRFYDTSLAMLALAGTSASELDNAKTYLESIQTKAGCWDNNNIKSTAFVLYSGWPRGVSQSEGSGSSSYSCLAANKFCEKRLECLGAGGSVLNEFDCDSFGDVCCSVGVQEQSCSEIGGVICASNQVCSGSSSPSLEGTCCLSACQIKTEQNSCELIENGQCRSECFDDEEEGSFSCSGGGEICCVIKDNPEPKGNIWIWILILGILILILILLYLYRRKIQVWWYKRKGNVKSRPVNTGRDMPPRYSSPPRFGFPGIPRQPQMNQNTQRKNSLPVKKPTEDKEMEETMRKLKEMSK